MMQSLRLEIAGLVQGVGFRPFVYREAKRHHLAGFVANTVDGAVVEVQGNDLEPFINALHHNLPMGARIDTMHRVMIDTGHYTDFEIRKSQQGDGNTAIPVDTALCAQCEREMHDPADRRYGYPFINCCHCGPRYTIMQIPPYDRVRTSMKHFSMCDACRLEYLDPNSRRYHAQPICCPDCGPSLSFMDGEGSMIEGDPIGLAAEMLASGKIIALKGLGGFNLLCDATNDQAVKELRRIKHRPSKPLAVMFDSLQEAHKYSYINKYEEQLIDDTIKPIVIVDKKSSTNLSVKIAPELNRMGVFLPYTSLHRLLFDIINFPLIVTSANVSDEPIMIRSKEVIACFGNALGGIINHNRVIVNAVDDSVVQAVDGKTVMLRMGRGHTPYTSQIQKTMSKRILALGAHQKNAVAIASGDNLVLSGHIGDLETIGTQEYFERTIHTFERFYPSEKIVIMHDLHPNYYSTRYALEHNYQHHAIQHHYAHILACMAEHSLTQKVLGFGFDGTGYGGDKTLWGGEVMIADAHSFERIGWLRPFALLGGERAIKEPRRIALSLLFESHTLDEVLSLSSPAVDAFLPHEIAQLHYMWSKKLNSPMCSSMGRLFDGVASLGGFVQMLEYEAQAGLMMEKYVDNTICEPFDFHIVGEQVDVALMIQQIIDLESSMSDKEEAKRIIASRFIATVDAIIHSFANQYSHLPIVVSGGVFQNRVLMERLQRSLGDRDFYFQQKTPLNDGSIALGQAWWGIYNL
ncbi:MAG: carbamoyltransferase HypF [Sulfuricurvum sp.]|nr:carbamoyltransferase HypF [Sulfuricurvum sp.]